jgi:Peptidase family M23
VFFKGKEKIGEKEMIVLEFLPKPDSPERFHFDPNTFLLLRESRALPRETPEEDAGQMVIEYGDYKNVDGWMVPFTFTQTIPGQVLTVKIDQYRINTQIADTTFQNPIRQYGNEPFEMTIRTIPWRVYKENDGVWEPATTESFYFHLLVQEKHGRPIEPTEAKLELYAGKELLKTIVLSGPQLNAIRSVSFGSSAQQEELFDLKHSFSEPVSLAVTRVIYAFHGSTESGQKLQKTLEIPVTIYEQKTKLIFPLKGRFVVAGGHDYNEAHKGEWSQHYAFDIVALGPNYNFARNGGKANEEFFTWGQEVLAPGDGVVSFARKDIPDNKQPGMIDNTVFMSKPDPLNAIAGNNVIIDHGNGEYSLLAHFQEGSVRVKKGDRVKQGQVIGKLGNSGNSDGPHLHYHLMAGPQIFRNDGLPATFENVFIEAFSTEDVKIASPKRGVYVIAK